MRLMKKRFDEEELRFSRFFFFRFCVYNDDYILMRKRFDEYLRICFRFDYGLMKKRFDKDLDDV